MQERARFEAEALREQAARARAHAGCPKPAALMQERARFEAEALREQARHAPAHVPDVHCFDAQMALIVMDYLPPPHSIVRGQLTVGATLPQLPRHVAEFMAATLFGTSLFALDTIRWRCVALVRRFFYLLCLHSCTRLYICIYICQCNLWHKEHYASMQAVMVVGTRLSVVTSWPELLRILGLGTLFLLHGSRLVVQGLCAGSSLRTCPLSARAPQRDKVTCNRAQQARFQNGDLCRLTEQVIFSDPYRAARINRHTTPQLDAEAAALRADPQAKAAAAALKVWCCSCLAFWVHASQAWRTYASACCL